MDKLKILIADGNADTLKAILDAEYNVFTVSPTDAAKDLVIATAPDIICTDVNFRLSDGVTFAEYIKKQHQLKDVPVLLIENGAGEDFVTQQLTLCGADTLGHTLSRPRVGARIGTQAEIVRCHHMLDRMSMHDSLTGLANKYGFLARLRYEWRRSGRNNDTLTLLLVEVTGFDSYVETKGRLRGNEVLKNAATVVSGLARRATDCAARLNDGVFGILIGECDKENAAKCAEYLLNAVTEANGKSDAEARFALTLSGKTVKPEKGASPTAIVDTVYDLLERAKASNTAVFE